MSEGGAFFLCWTKLLNSSVWVKESKETRLVWITLLLMKNFNGVVQSSVIGLADRAKVTVQECRESLRVLLSPDVDDSSGVEEGRRIRVVPGGWEIVNNDMYRFSTEEKRAYWASQKAIQRARKKGKKLPGEAVSEAAAWRGAGQDELDKLVTGALPEKKAKPGTVKCVKCEQYRKPMKPYLGDFICIACVAKMSPPPP